MRTSKSGEQKRRKGNGNRLLGIGLCAASLVAMTSAVSFQDIASMTGIGAEGDDRWLVRLISIPQSSSFAKAEDRVEANSKSVISHAVGVHTGNLVQPLASAPALSTSDFGVRPVRVARAMKGDRVFAEPEEFNPQLGSWAMLKAEPVGKPASGDAPNNTTKYKPAAHLVALAQSFRTSTSPAVNNNGSIAIAANGEEKPVPAAVKNRLSTTQLAEARSAARVMARVVKRVKSDESSSDATSLSAYAPQERDIASAFAAVLRPSGEAATRLISLAPGDHKWAAKPLPRVTQSKIEQRCLATGIYFEARGEPVKGQQAVAQVILNRVKNPSYPNTICGVVYQNKWKRNACQFSFACDGIRDRIKSPKHWDMAEKISKDAIAGRFWLKSVGSSSHYHADYVWPRWRRSMRKMVKIGRHIFYRTYGGGWS
ncbi:MAG: cell wall hydrolase [Pseudomonadota bacterium]